jgi:hypothetical protein
MLLTAQEYNRLKVKARAGTKPSAICATCHSTVFLPAGAVFGQFTASGSAKRALPEPAAGIGPPAV